MIGRSNLSVYPTGRLGYEDTSRGRSRGADNIKAIIPTYLVGNVALAQAVIGERAMKKPITYHGALDHLHRDDRDPIVDSLPEDERKPSWGKNSLERKRPARALTEAEAASLDDIGKTPS